MKDPKNHDSRHLPLLLGPRSRILDPCVYVVFLGDDSDPNKILRPSSMGLEFRILMQPLQHSSKPPAEQGPTFQINEKTHRAIMLRGAGVIGSRY